jgi:hypothetical protein
MGENSVTIICDNIAPIVALRLIISTSGKRVIGHSFDHLKVALGMGVSTACAQWVRGVDEHLAKEW